MTSPRAATPRDITRTAPFWLLFCASLLAASTNSAVTPIIPGYVHDVLGGGSALSGGIISLAAITSIIAMPLAGMLADRYGYRSIALGGGAIGILALILLASVPSIEAASLSRLLFGFGDSASTTLVMAWVVAVSPAAQRGKALSIFGLSVWIALALGPQIGTLVEAFLGPISVFWVCVGMNALALALITFLPRPRHDRVRPPRVTARAFGRAITAVWAPGLAALAAWCGEGLLVAFSLVHLGGVGVPAVGLLSAATIFAVFAASVVLARLVLAPMPDRLGPHRAAAIALSILAVGLVVMAFAPGFWVAAAGAVLIGIGFSPLYPSLTMIATKQLAPQNQALGLGIFSSFTSVGYGLGAALGGLVIAVTASMWAFVIVAAMQVLAIAVIALSGRVQRA